jgi:uroporphyrinogen-III synthase
MHMPARSDLRGVSVLVTRPRGQGDALCEHITQHGGIAEPLALMDIEAVELDAILSSLLGNLADFDILIFISRNAVEHAMALLAKSGIMIPPQVRLAAVGSGSADALQRHGLRNVVFPEGQSNSEALLACDLLKRVEGCRVLIFRGQDGRELLAETLRARGARVEYAAVYRRVPVATDIDPIVRRWLDAPRAVLVLTSEGAAKLLVERLSGDVLNQMFNRPVAVLSQRLRRFCIDAGWHSPIEVSSTTGDSGLLRAIFSVSQNLGPVSAEK